MLSGLHNCNWFRKETLEFKKKFVGMHNKMFIFCPIIKIIYVLIKLSSFVLYSEQNDVGKHI